MLSQTLDLSQNAELGDAGVARLAPLLTLTSLNLSGASTVKTRVFYCCFTIVTVVLCGLG